MIKPFQFSLALLVMNLVCFFVAHYAGIPEWKFLSAVGVVTFGVLALAHWGYKREG